MSEIQGLTPALAWNTFSGLVIFGVIFMIIFNVYDAIMKIVDRRRARREHDQPDLADKVSRKVIEKLEPRIQEIEHKLNNDKNRLDNHDILISEIQNTHKDTRDGLAAICKMLLVIASYGNMGNAKEIKEASAELTKYLADRL